MTTLPQPTDCCNPCAGARTACVVECGDDSSLAVGTTIELRALPGPFTNFQLQRKLGDITYDDGFGMDYYYDANSFLPNNDGDVVKPDSVAVGSPGRWRQSI